MNPDFAARLGARSMALSLTGRNLMLWTKYPGMDPEVNAVGRANDDGGSSTDNIYLDGVDAFGYPIPSRFAISIRLGY
jgi:hypothetical protein